jgi:hypothetical protein
MIDYIKNLLPRLQQYSSSLDHKEIFVEQPWILIDENGMRHNYIFERNGNLILSINGKVTNGSWRYIAASKALLIASDEQFLLKHAFVDKGLMFLKLDGSPDKPWIFANENLIPDLDIQRYLLNVLIKKMQLQNCTVNGKPAFVKKYDNNGTSIYYDEGIQPLNTEVKDEDGKNKIIRNGKIVRAFYTEIYLSDKGQIYVEQQFFTGVNIYDSVYLNGLKAPDGTYQITEKVAWIVSDGKIIEIKAKNNTSNIFILLVIGLIVYSLIYFAVRSSSSTSEKTIATALHRILPPQFSIQDYKQQIIKRFNFIEAKDFDSAAEIYSDTINNYYGKKNVDRLFVWGKLYDYWQEHYRYVFLLLDTSSLSVVQKSDKTYITCNATDWYEDKESKIPMIYEVGYSFTLNKNMKIIEERANINSQVIDSVKLLHLPYNSSLAELRTTSNSKYLDAIFNDLNSELDPDYKEQIKWTLVTTLGEGFSIYTQDSNTPIVMNILRFSNTLILKQVLFNKILNFIMDASGRITGVVVDIE